MYHRAAMRWRWMLLAMMMLFAQTVAKQHTSMARSEALTKLDRHQVGWAGPGGMSKAMAAAQEALVTAQRWSPSEREYVERVKRALVGNSTLSPRTLNAGGDPTAVCRWDCYQRMTMLEPLVDHVLNAVEGDFVEAGVYTGGISIFLSALLCVKGVLGSGPHHRRMWMADSFQGMPPASASSSAGYSAEGFSQGKLVGTIENVQQNFGSIFTASSGDGESPPASCSTPAAWGRARVPAGVRFLEGWFNDTLPGPIRAIALLRADSDLFVSIYQTLERLYPLLSYGGFVVFDDFKFTQAQEAILGYRKEHGITTLLQRSSNASNYQFHSIDKMVYWQKDVKTG